MAKTKISEYDATAANNTDIDSINIAEGMLPSNVNNAFRELMAHLKDMDAGTHALTSPQFTSVDINGGTADNLVIGGATAAAGTFTTLTANTSITGTLATAAQTNITSVGTLTGLTVSGSTSLAGASTSADITFGDNDKAIFGAGPDLQIYHDGSASYVKDVGTGPLNIQMEATSGSITSGAALLNFLAKTGPSLYTAANLSIHQPGSGEGIGDFRFSVGDGAGVSTEILRVNSTGIDVNGTVTADDAVVSGSESSFQSRVSVTPADNQNRTLTITEQQLKFSAPSGFGTSYDTFISSAPSYLTFGTSNAEKVRIDSSGNVGIGTSSPDTALTVSGGDIKATGSLRNQMLVLARTDAANDYEWQIQGGSSGDSQYLAIVDDKGGSSAERMRIDSSGNLLVGTTDASPWDNNTNTSADNGLALRNDGRIFAATSGNSVAIFNRTTNEGDIVQFRKSGTTVGSIATYSSDLLLVTGGDCGIRLNYTAATGSDFVAPCRNTGALRDNAIDLGTASGRWDDVYATNGTIQTSDRNEKQDIAELSDAEQRVAVAAKGLLRKFRWKDAVAEKGDEARTHFGIIAQDLQAAFAAEGLDAGDYAMFIHSTWTDEETGEERSRMGVRYSELLAFIIAAI